MPLLQVNGRITVPPVFYGDWAVFYCTDFNAATDVYSGWIRIYKYST
jgi:glutaredoxin